LYEAEAEIFKALSHPIRLFIIHSIKDEPLSVKELTGRVGVDISTMSKHLDLLKRHKIVVGEKVKNRVFYSLNIPCVLEFMGCAQRVLNRETA
jgi:ArsR family transcriptional regulator